MIIKRGDGKILTVIEDQDEIDSARINHSKVATDVELESDGTSPLVQDKLQITKPLPSKKPESN